MEKANFTLPFYDRRRARRLARHRLDLLEKRYRELYIEMDEGNGVSSFHPRPEVSADVFSQVDRRRTRASVQYAKVKAANPILGL